jgi:hypothetical protein
LDVLGHTHQQELLTITHHDHRTGTSNTAICD